jgi:hypothetical protein
LVKSEVGTLCLGQVLNLLWACTESEAGRLMGYKYDKGKISVHYETDTENDIVSMDDDQINVMIMISCERYAEVEKILECNVFNLLEAILMNMKMSRFGVFLLRGIGDGVIDLIGFNGVFMKAVLTRNGKNVSIIVMKNLLQMIRNLVKLNDFCKLTKSEVDASGFEPVSDLVRLGTESFAWILRGCVIINKRATGLMERVEAENETNINLFDNDVSMDDGQIVCMMVCDALSDVEAVKYDVNKFGIAVCETEKEKTVFIDDVVVLVILIICLLVWSICCFKFIIREGQGIIFRCRSKRKWKEKVSNLKEKRTEVKNLNVVTRRIIMREQKLRFRKGKLINQRSMILVNWFVIQSSIYFSSQISSLSCGFFKFNIFQNIDQRQE